MTSALGPGLPLVVDTSAWTRQRRPSAIEPWRATIRAGLLVSCPVAALEIFRTARDESEYELLSAALDGLPHAPVTAAVCRSALAACRKLGARRRIPAPDYLIAAAAAERGYGVLHADRHFDLLATVLPFESVPLPE